jgi:Ca2+:H+ antiporter
MHFSLLSLNILHTNILQADLAKAKFTFTECIIAISASIVLVILLAIFLVDRIEDVVEAGVPDQFLGLILLPFVEKAAEHLTSIDEAWDGQMNFALFHCLGPSIQTALFNGPLVVIVGVSGHIFPVLLIFS